jgi:thiol:disulfide interchange protein DsbD
VELVSAATSVQPGTVTRVGLKFVIDEHWHVYWENPGDAGTPVSVTEWILPEGWSAGPILWPAPSTYPMGPLAGFGYEGALVLPVDLAVPADAPEGTVEIRAQVDWLVCHEECIQGDAELVLELTVARAPASASPHKELFEAAAAAAPKPLPTGTRASARLEGKVVVLTLEGTAAWSPASTTPVVYALTDGEGSHEQQVVEPSGKQEVSRVAATTMVRMPLPKRRRGAPERLRGMLVVNGAEGRPAFALDVPIESDPAAARPPGVPAGPAPGPGAAPTEAAVRSKAEEPVPPGFEKGPVKGSYTAVRLPTVSTTGIVVDAMAGRYKGDGDDEDSPLWLLLLGAVVGGIILNVMPCVLPVLSIKVLGFVSQADEHPAKARRHAYAFAIGVIASFWVLAILVLVLREGSKGLGWGFHFQDPVFLVCMAALMFAVGVNMAGVFEFGLSVQSLAGDAASKLHASGYASSFWSGALATVIATPCTAPMMGPAVGYAMTAPTVHCLLVFTHLGIGMSLPYVLLSMSPRLLKKMPRPGPWMDTFKHALAFPMFAAVIWLTFVLSAHVGAAGVTWFLCALLMLAIGLWIYGTWGTPSTPARTRRIVGYGLAALAVFGGVLFTRAALQERAPKRAAPVLREGEIDWEPWSKERIAWRLSQGQTVFVDFTADWCLSCLAQDKAVIDTDTVRAAIEEHNVAMLKADFTHELPEVLAGLMEFGRTSVPLYVVYRPITPPKEGASSAPPTPR